MASPFRRNSGPGTPAVPMTFSVPRALTAAATQIRVGDKGEAETFRRRRNSSAAVWQSEAWEYFDAIGEIKYSFSLVASVLSRIRLYTAVVEDVSETPVPLSSSATIDPKLASAAERALARLDSAYGGQAGLLRDAALNLNVTGECYLVQIPARPGSGLPESWDIRSVDELQVDRNGQYKIIPRRDLLSQGMSGGTGNSSIITLPPNAFIGRIWRAHPRFSEEPDSSVRGLLDLCEELLLLNRTFRATAKSRLNAGALYLPDGLSIAADPDPDYPYDDDENPTGSTPEESADDFEENLIQAMTTPIKDEDSASAVVPLIIRGPAELGEKIKQFKFERAFDDTLVKRADRVLDRILQGLDVPKDIITGLANVKYSNAQQIDDDLYKSHIEPMVILIADALTQVYLRPYLLSIGYPEAEVERVVVWYDPSSIATRTDRAADADSGFEKGAISFDTWRKAHGFSEADAPTANEYALKFLNVHGVMAPELTEAMLTGIAPDMMSAAKAASQASNVAPIPSGVQNILDANSAGAPGTDPNAPAAPDLAQDNGESDSADSGGSGSDSTQPAPAEEPTDSSQDSTIPPDSDNPVAAGQDAPPVPLT